MPLDDTSSAHSGHFAALARELLETDGLLPTIRGVVDAAVRMVPADWAAVAVTERLADRPARLAASNDPDLSASVGRIAVAAGTSPGITAFDTGHLVHCRDLGSEPRYAAYAEAMRAETPVRSVLSLPMRLAGQPFGVMSLYAAEPDHFTTEAIARARVLAEHAVVAIQLAKVADEAMNLELALARSRAIGAAMGILMERHRLTAADAFARLRDTSQNTNRKLADVADDVVETGTAEGLDESPPPAPAV